MSDEGGNTAVKPGRGTVVKRRGPVSPGSAPPAAVEQTSLIGRVVGEKYEVLELIGLGGMGEVYRAVQSPLGREVAVKVIRASAHRRVDRRRRFIREAEAIARLSHSSTVRLYDYFEEADGSLFMVLELIRGRSLRQVLDDAGLLPVERVARIALEVLGSLAEAHAMGVVHRDLKPDNLMIVHEQLVGERVKVLDFGIARILHAAEPTTGEQPVPTRLETWDGVVVGSPHYMAPEQARHERVGPQADLYALGAVIFELLSGRPPYEGASAQDLLAAHDLAPIPELPAAVPAAAGLRQIVRRALAKRPEDRFADAGAMAEAIYAAVPEVMVFSNAPAVPKRVVHHDDEDEAERTVVETRPTPIEVARRRSPPPTPRPVELDDDEGTRVVPIDDVPRSLLPARVRGQTLVETAHPPPAMPDLDDPGNSMDRRRSSRRMVWIGVASAGVGLVLLAFLLQHRDDVPPPASAPRAVPAAAAGSFADAAPRATVDAGVGAPDAVVVGAEVDGGVTRARPRRRPRPKKPTKLRVKKL